MAMPMPMRCAKREFAGNDAIVLDSLTLTTRSCGGEIFPSSRFVARRQAVVDG